ncbi:MAG: hypothetical protein M3291_06800 [Actinomycetota bacterium]|nr:hypothetical protein [Actinomycetota bacterium]
MTPARTTVVSGLVLLVLLVDAVLLAAVELLYLPLRIGAVPVPITILLAAVTTPWLVRSAARLGAGGVVAASPLVMWVLGMLVLGMAGPGGDVLLPVDWRSLVLLGAGMFPGAVALGRSLSPLDRPLSAVPTRGDANV